MVDDRPVEHRVAKGMAAAGRLSARKKKLTVWVAECRVPITYRWQGEETTVMMCLWYHACRTRAQAVALAEKCDALVVKGSTWDGKAAFNVVSFSV